MKKILIYILIGLATVSCLDLEQENPYEQNLYQTSICLEIPQDVDPGLKNGIFVTMQNLNNGAIYQGTTDNKGCIAFSGTNGVYRINATLVYDDGEKLLQGFQDKVIISGKDKEVSLQLQKSKLGSLVIKEIYCGGCTRQPVEDKDFHYDQYIIIHNNSKNLEYLDNLCIAYISPYNSTADNPWTSKDENGNTILPSFIPTMQALWKIGGDGQSFPLESGKDAVIVVAGAIDNASTYPESVNLDQPEYFAIYDHVNFPDAEKNPLPGKNIRKERYLDLVIKTGKAKAYLLPIGSPAVFLFKAQGTTIEEYVQNSDNVLQVPGSSIDKSVCVPPEWILDGVEVFSGQSSDNNKRFIPTIDAGAVYLSSTYKGRSLMRKTIDPAMNKAGYEILIDTNNSTNDFYEREHASLWKEVRK